jgi:hypothetical protein
MYFTQRKHLGSKESFLQYFGSQSYTAFFGKLEIGEKGD